MKSIQFFKEKDSEDYVVIFPDTLKDGNFTGKFRLGGRIEASSYISEQRIKEDCEPVHLFDVPDEWLRRFDLDEEICAECGKSVKFGSGLFVNRVPECNDLKTRAEMGRTHITGGWICVDCDSEFDD